MSARRRRESVLGPAATLVRRAGETAIGMGLALAAVFAAPHLAPRRPHGSVAASTEQSGESVPKAHPAEETQAPPPDLSAVPVANRAERIASYTMTVSLDPAAHRLHGEGSIVWRNASSVAQKELYVHLYLNAFKNERTELLRERGVGGRGSAKVTDFGYIKVSRFRAREWDADLWAGAERTTAGDPEDETDIRVALPNSVEPGQSITIDMAWDAKLPAVNIRTGYDGSFHMAGQWFPKLARLMPDGRWAHFPFQRFSEFYADFGAYDVTVDVPEPFIVGATGRLESETRQGGRVVRRFVQDNIHDFAFTAWDRFQQKTATTEQGVRITCLYPPGYDLAADTEIAAARFGLAHMGAAYGPYPYETLTIVHPPPEAQEAGGMEYPTLITTGGAWYGPYTGAHFLELVTIHELGHQWFYGLLASNEHDYPFLDEGLNSFAEVDTLEALYGSGSAMNALGLSVSVSSGLRVGSTESAFNAPVAQPAPVFMTGGDYGSIVYGRTATILNTFVKAYGDRIKLALGRYARKNRFGHPVPDDLLASFREVMGPEVTENLRVALFEKGWVDYKVARIVSSENTASGGIFGDPDAPDAAPSVEGLPRYRGYAIVHRHGTLRFPVDIDLFAADGTVTRTRWDNGEASIQVDYTGQTRLVAAVVDPEHRVLLDNNLANNAKRSSGMPLAPRVLERAAFTAEIALLLLAP